MKTNGLTLGSRLERRMVCYRKMREAQREGTAYRR